MAVPTRVTPASPMRVKYRLAPATGLSFVDPAGGAIYVVDMVMLATTSVPSDADRCAEPRSAVQTLCEAADEAQQAYVAAHEQLLEARRQLATARRDEEVAAAAAEPKLRADEKARARQLYEHAIAVAVDDAERTEATANWARALDRINRTARLTQRRHKEAGAVLQRTEEATQRAERDENAARIQAEAAADACLDARVRLAACEEEARTPDAAAPVATPFEPYAAVGGHAAALPESPRYAPLVIESMVSGDHRALELAGAQISAACSLEPAAAILQLEELVDAVVSIAAVEGYLVFDDNHPLWSLLSFEQARDVVAALSRLGFQFEPAEGWHGGRAPTPMDLSMALAYAGLDARNMRGLPDAGALRELPRSIGVDARSFLAASAPDLAVDHLVNVLGPRAKPLRALWDEWGQIRPILLSDRQSVVPSQG